ncbi:alcohol dehydrogenase [Olsenella sp. oral taxon 807]|uniref:galactitol-1-phosphate 5-dehydrogenase n=1 Tax=Olsenella sp. oral taxon 807 TaxID=712411 RepID=UPI000679F623|nr:galactitol-1-phosphate 5-dehydrogenase [Olsenella sp. oral taxon 807]AKT49474.1 alcohol dehydrogenase [Olsenella sp. oral taxon 807]
MKAGVVHAREDIRYEDIERPAPKRGEVLIKVKYTGICGSDVPRVNGDACHFYPNVLGHEFSGTVEDVGEGVTSLGAKDRVAGVPLVPCMECDDCRRGDFSLCKHYTFIGSRRFGSFAEYVCVPEANAVKVADEVSFEQAALFEPATIAVHGLDCVPYRGGKTVAIVGGGTIGLLTAQFAKIYGAARLVVFDVQRERLELAKSLGADDVVDSSEEGWLEGALELTGGRGFDYVYGTAGAVPTIKMPFDLVANKGYVCYIGTPTREISFSIDEWEKINRREFTLTGSWMSYSAPFPGQEWKTVAHFFATGQLRYEGLVFKTLPLSRIADAFEMYKTPGAVKGKILIDSEA